MDALFEILQKISAFIISLFTFLFSGVNPFNPPEPPVTLTQTSVVSIEKIGGCRVMEGGCTDGKYIYVSLLDPEIEEDPVSCILKIDPSSGETVKSAENLHIDHANDMTFNSSTGEIIICNNMPHRNIISFMDPESLEIKRNITIDTEIFSIEYIPSENCYYCGIANSYNYSKFNADFEILENYTGIDNGFTRQSMTLYGTDTYHLYYKKNCIYRYDSSGRCTGTMDLPVQQNEAENLFFINDVLYVSYNILGAANGGEIYKVENLVFNDYPQQ